MGFDQTSLCKKNSVLLNNCNFYNMIFLILQESNTIMKLWISYKIMENLVTMHSQYSQKQKKIHTIAAYFP